MQGWLAITHHINCRRDAKQTQHQFWGKFDIVCQGGEIKWARTVTEYVVDIIKVWVVLYHWAIE